MNIPHSPFATRLSGSAKETELRIRSIFQWKKKRPPVVLIVLALVVIALCGSLVGFTIATPQQPQVDFPAPEASPSSTVDLPIAPLRGDAVSPDGSYKIILNGKVAGITSGGIVPPESVQLISLATNDVLWACDGLYEHAAVWSPDSHYLALARTARTWCTVTVVDTKTRTSWDVTLPDGSSIPEHTFLPDDWCEWQDENALLLTIGRGSDEGQASYRCTLSTQGAQLTGSTELLPPTSNKSFELPGLTLDEDDQGDDAFVLTLYRDENGQFSDRVEARAVLGSGEILTLDLGGEGMGYFSTTLQADYLTSTRQQSVVAELPSGSSNYGATDLYVFQVRSGTLELLDFKAAFGDPEVYFGFQLAPADDSGLARVRVPLYVGSRHFPEWGTLAWEDGQWTFVPDGYFTDPYSLVVGGGQVLTLSLRGRADHGRWYYDRIQILHGETVLQTITEDSFTPDGHCPFEYFNADTALHAVDTRDINFDGYSDFGIPCNTTHNDGRCWFLYDPQTRQYRFAFSLAGTPTIDDQAKQIIEEWWDDSIVITYNTYEYNDRGILTLVDTKTTPASTYKDVLLGDKFIHQGTLTTLEEHTADSNSVRRTPTRFALLDLDGDGENEAVVWIEINSTASTLVLHEQDGQVYGYSFVYRGLMDLKADGTFSWSGSAFRNGTARLSFHGSEAVSNDITYCDVDVNPDGTTTGTFVVDGAAATAEEFTAAITAQSAKPDAAWYDLTENNINRLLP